MYGAYIFLHHHVCYSEAEISPVSPPPKIPRFQTPPETQNQTPSEAPAATPTPPTFSTPEAAAPAETTTEAQTEEDDMMASIRLAQQLMQEEVRTWCREHDRPVVLFSLCLFVFFLSFIMRVITEYLYTPLFELFDVKGFIRCSYVLGAWCRKKDDYRSGNRQPWHSLCRCTRQPI